MKGKMKKGIHFLAARQIGGNKLFFGVGRSFSSFDLASRSFSSKKGPVERYLVKVKETRNKIEELEKMESIVLHKIEQKQALSLSVAS